MAKTHCDICDRNFKNEEGLEMHNKAKHSENVPKEKKKKNPADAKKMRNWAIFIVILALVIWGFVSIFSVGASLPPTSMQGHIEAKPDSHVVKSPMRIEIQKHMLEHADGAEGAQPGIILNYDCKNFDCAPGMIEDLEAFATKYPINVYVAPFKNMEVKIALTRLGRIETLDEYDETIIDNFINGF